MNFCLPVVKSIARLYMSIVFYRFGDMFGLFLAGILSGQAHAKDMDGRLGVGVNQWFGSMPAISARYGIPLRKINKNISSDLEIQTELCFGFSTDPTEPNELLFSGRFLYGMVVEDNMNLMAGGGLGVLRIDDFSVLRLQPGIEAQIFPLGTPNLSINAGFGLNLDIGGTEDRTGTAGSALAGFQYWF